MESPEAIQSKLKTFHGSQALYPCLNPNFVMSEGVHYLTEAAECDWLMDALPPYIGRCGKGLCLLELQQEKGKWRLTITDRNGKLQVSEPIIHCSFPLPGIKLRIEWSELSGNRWVVYLPSES